MSLSGVYGSIAWTKREIVAARLSRNYLLKTRLLLDVSPT
jgi:hypothetical protein